MEERGKKCEESLPGNTEVEVFGTGLRESQLQVNPATRTIFSLVFEREKRRAYNIPTRGIYYCPPE